MKFQQINDKKLSRKRPVTGVFWPRLRPKLGKRRKSINVASLTDHSSKLPNEIARLDANSSYELSDNLRLRHELTEQ